MTKAGDAVEFTEVQLMYFSFPNKPGRHGEQLSTLRLKAEKQQRRQFAAPLYGGGRWGMCDVVIRLLAIRTN